MAIDFFTVPTLTFKLLHCFFVIEHGRRRILHFNVTSRPNSEWVVQQLREALPEACGWRIDNITPRLAFGTTLDSASATGTNQALLVAQIP